MCSTYFNDIISIEHPYWDDITEEFTKIDRYSRKAEIDSIKEELDKLLEEELNICLTYKKPKNHETI